MNKQLKHIQSLCNTAKEYQSLIDISEYILKERKEFLKGLLESSIPNAMQEAGITDFTLTSGAKVSSKEMIQACIPKAKSVAALNWLRKNGHGGVIKTKVTATFGRGQDEEAAKLACEMALEGLDVANVSSVHHRTLTSLVKEVMADGKDVPMGLLGVRVWQEAKMTPPKD